MKARLEGLPPSFDRLLHNVRDVMLDGYYRPDSCVASSRIAVDLLGYMGIQARGVKVRCLCYNPFMARKMDAGEDPVSVLADNPGKAWSVGIGVPVGPDQSTGLHVVAWADRLPGSSRALLIDLALDQASRPQHNMHFGPIATSVPRGMADDFLSPDLGGLVFSNADGAVVAYSRAVPDLGGWMRSPNWTGPRDVSTRAEIIEKAMARTTVPRAERRQWSKEMERRLA